VGSGGFVGGGESVRLFGEEGVGGGDLAGVAEEAAGRESVLAGRKRIDFATCVCQGLPSLEASEVRHSPRLRPCLLHLFLQLAGTET
jgi:hypothetical protein